MFPWRWLLPMALAMLAATTPAVAAGQVYKWVDEEGVTHYSQQPPPQGQRTIIEMRVAPSAEGGQADANDGSTEDKDAGNKNDNGGDSETIAQFCKDMREREELLAGDRSIRLKNDDGTLTPLTGDARAQQLEQVRKQLEQNCQDIDHG